MLFATGVGLALGLVYIRTGYSPFRLTLLLIIHLQAAGSCAVESLRTAVTTFRSRYQEHVENVIRGL